MPLETQSLKAVDDPRAAAAPPASKASLHGACTIFDQAIVSLTSFTVTVILGRELGKEVLGIYALGIFTFWLAAGIVNALVWVPYTSRACRLSERARGRFRASNALMAVLVAAALAAVSLLCGAAVAVIGADQDWLAPFFFCLAPVAFALTLREHVRRVSIADFRGPWLVAFDAPICVALLAAIAVLNAGGWLSAMTAMLATAAASAISLPFLFRQLLRADYSRRRFLVDVRSNWSFGRWLLVVAVAWLVSDGSLRWMLGAMHGVEAVGVFSAAFAVVMLVNPLMLAMTSFARSWATRVHDEFGYQGLLQHTLRSTVFAVALAALAVVAFALVGNYAIGQAFGPKFDFNDPTLVVALAVGVCLQATIIPVDAALTALEMGRRMSYAAGLRLAATVIVGAPLVYLHGPVGIAWAMIARCVPVIILYWMTLWQVGDGRLTAVTPRPARV